MIYASFISWFVELRLVCLSLAVKLADLTKEIDAALLKGTETFSVLPPHSFVCFVICVETFPLSHSVSHSFMFCTLSSLGDLQAAKALLAQMKYYANIEEKVKQKLSEFM